LALALVAEEPEVAELDPGDVVDPTVAFLFPDGPVAVVPLTSRTTLFATSQHWLAALPLEPSFPVPCAFAEPSIANNARPQAAARQTFFIGIPPFFKGGRIADDCQR
jgi:hypothetical protein